METIVSTTPAEASASKLLLQYQFRAFNAHTYTEAKSKLLNEYLRRTGIKGVVIGVSGGIDSAVTLGIVSSASMLSNSPIQKIVAVIAPEFVKGTTGQADSTFKAFSLIEKFAKVNAKITLQWLDLTHTHQELSQSTQLQSLQTPWVQGQLVSYLRTPALYYVASLLYEANISSIVCGTTNFDEGGYIGYFGKASDGMVDVQLISDLHKSEVYTLATSLQVIEDIIQAPPTGDLFNGQSDLEYIGVPYDYIELYLGYLCHHIAELPQDPLSISRSERIEFLHKQGLHKYHGSGYAIHLNIYENNVPGGWITNANLSSVKSTDYTKFINPVDLPLVSVLELERRNSKITTQNYKIQTSGPDCQYHVHNNVLSIAECRKLVALLPPWKQTKNWQAAALNGFTSDYEQGDQIGSLRLSCYNPEFAEIIWQRIKLNYPQYSIIDDSKSLDHDNCPVWRAIGINPLFRFILYYEQGNGLIPHYDAPYDYKNGKKTLQSVIIYLTKSKSGQTRFILDTQSHLPVSQKKLQDWNRHPNKNEIISQIDCNEGQLLVFDHRYLHDSNHLSTGELKIIMRTDIIYEQCLPYQLKHQTLPLNFISNTSTPHLDEYYQSIINKVDSNQLKMAGYIAKSRWREPSVQWLGTPYHKILVAIRELISKLGHYELNQREVYVLVNTGCYAPIHQGHIKLMEQAKIAYEKQGKLVLGGYLVPAHQKYVTEKIGFDQGLDRLQQCYKLVSPHLWLNIDPYELLYETDDVNYTLILIRIQKYLMDHFSKLFQLTIKTVYVCGGDRADFTQTFTGGVGYCICVNRKGYEHIYNKAKTQFGHLANIHWVDQPTISISSSQLRSKSTNFDLMHPVRPHLKTVYHLRQEDGLIPDYDQFCNQLVNVFSQSLKGQGITVELIHSRDQLQAVAKKYPNTSSNQLISLDPILPSTHNLKLSRLFAIASPQSFIRIVPRPGYPPIESQINAIPAGYYILMDDDSVTGMSLNYAKKILLPYRQITNTFLVSSDQNRYDITDCRDLLLGAPFGGLVIELPNADIVRVPYLLPYVFPSDRSKLPIGRDVAFSIEIWKLNLQYYLTHELLVKDVDLMTQKLLNYIGFTANHPMSYVCFWHLQSLTQMEPSQYRSDHISNSVHPHSKLAIAHPSF
jgi:NAD+ synthetase